MKNKTTASLKSHDIYYDMLREIETQKFLKVQIAGQVFGINALDVEDIIDNNDINNIPLAPDYIIGSINLRGKIVTVMDLKKKYNLSHLEEERRRHLNAVISINDEFYSILVDKVYEVLDLNMDDVDFNPVTLDKKWQNISSGIYQLEEELLILLETQELFKKTQLEQL